jgi:small-conductance mechanosensitive channel
MPAHPTVFTLEEFSKQATRYAPKVLTAAALLLVGALFARIVRSTLRGLLRRTKLRPTTTDLAVTIAGLLAWVLVVSIVLSALQLQAIVLGISGVLALMGAAFISSASAFSNDIIAGLCLASDRDIGIGCRIRAAGVEGVVRGIDLRKTRIVDDQGNLHVIPNRLVEGVEWVVLHPGSYP